MKGHYDPSILCAVLLLGAVFVAPAYAEMKKVDESELARANASVTGASIKEPIASVDKNTVLQESDPRQNVTERVFSPAEIKETHSVSLNISGQETFQFSVGPTQTTITGPGITSVKTRP